MKKKELPYNRIMNSQSISVMFFHYYPLEACIDLISNYCITEKDTLIPLICNGRVGYLPDLDSPLKSEDSFL